MAKVNLIRTFICIELPDQLKKKIGDLQAQLQPQAAGISWVRPQNVHLTLKFLGDIDESRLPEIATALEEIAAHYAPFTLVPEGQGVFPHVKGPRVFWLGIRETTGTLMRLQQAVEDRLQALGFAKEPRAFTPHLTIGRTRPYRKPKELTATFMALSFSAEAFEVDHLTIMRSELKPTGAVYTPLRVISLK